MLSAALEHVVKGIVDHPDAVRIVSSTSPRGDVLEVHAVSYTHLTLPTIYSV